MGTVTAGARPGCASENEEVQEYDDYERDAHKPENHTL